VNCKGESLKRFFRCSVIGVALLATSGIYADKVAGHAAIVNGDLQVRDKTLHPGDAVYTGDVIKSGNAASGRLSMIDGSVIDVSPSTTLRIEEYSVGAERNAKVAVDLGSIRALVQKRVGKKGKYHIRTKSSVLALRGTEVAVRSEPRGNGLADSFTVMEGSAVLQSSSGAPTVLAMGSQVAVTARIQNGAVSEVHTGQTQRLSGNQIQDLTKSLRPNDTTLQHAFDVANGQGVANISAVTSAIEPPKPPPMQNGDGPIPGLPPPMTAVQPPRRFNLPAKTKVEFIP
jgi:hypothetical protein